MQAHLPTLETTDENRAALLVSLDYLLNISFVDDDEVFKICLDYWNYFVPDVYASVTTGLADANAPFAFGGPAPAATGRRALYAPVLSKLRLLMISRMAKPEEVGRRIKCRAHACCKAPQSWVLHMQEQVVRPCVLQGLNLMFVGLEHAVARQVIVVEDENGNIVRETMKDTDTLARYKTMHETLVYLSHLDHDDTENQMLEKLRLQVCMPRMSIAPVRLATAVTAILPGCK
jgi:exportin-1